ncbi:response regulator [Endothiovibrio diazotrophicus]
MKRIVVIDDDGASRTRVATLLEQAGFGVITTDGGNDGVAAVHAESAALVITEMLTPRGDGLETIRRLHREHPEVPVIALAGISSANPYPGAGWLLDAAMVMGAKVALNKPFTDEGLLAAVTEALG